MTTIVDEKIEVNEDSINTISEVDEKIELNGDFIDIISKALIECHLFLDSITEDATIYNEAITRLSNVYTGHSVSIIIEELSNSKGLCITLGESIMEGNVEKVVETLRSLSEVISGNLGHFSDFVNCIKKEVGSDSFKKIIDNLGFNKMKSEKEQEQEQEQNSPPQQMNEITATMKEFAKNHLPISEELKTPEVPEVSEMSKYLTAKEVLLSKEFRSLTPRERYKMLSQMDTN